jgi:hypothetical protein
MIAEGDFSLQRLLGRLRAAELALLPGEDRELLDWDRPEDLPSYS